MQFSDDPGNLVQGNSEDIARAVWSMLWPKTYTGTLLLAAERVT
jgi:hypothetical protein